jgi:enamine deaminase RidA (YjgF/YER057c/UK114 family)
VIIAMEAPVGLSALASLHAWIEAYREELRTAGLDRRSEVWLRFYLADASEQAPFLSQLGSLEESGLVSAVAQPPVSGSCAALQAYHLESASRLLKRQLSPRALLIEHGAYRSLWLNPAPLSGATAAEQTSALLNEAERQIRRQGGTLRDNLLRTWFFVPDIDTDYTALVGVRRALFESRGLNSETHFVTSTGIGADRASGAEGIVLNALAQMGVDSEQIRYLNAPDHMCPAHNYGVTFERGTAVVYADRTHLHISGTASIDSHGRVLYVGDPKRQAERMVQNVHALLIAGGADLDDLRQATVYLRRGEDAEPVAEVLHQRLPEHLPRLMVRGAVCRPQWLVEMEATAIVPRGDRHFAAFG